MQSGPNDSCLFPLCRWLRMTFLGVQRPNRRRLAVVGVLAGSLFVSVNPAAAHDTHVVESGDTLSEIAQDTGTSVVSLMAENDLSSPDRLRVGQELSIPHRDGSSAPVAAATPAAAPSTTVHVVTAGETLGHIAQRHGVSSAELASVNNISNPNRIREGQKLTVPGSNAATAVSASSYPNLPDRLMSMPERRALIPFFEEWSAANGLPVDLVMAVAWQESGWNSEAVSFKGAVGVGQIMPATGAWIASDLIGRPELDRTIAEDNIRMSARYLRWLIDYLGDEDLALAGYYQGPGAVMSGIMYEDTVQYVANVQAHRQFFISS